jgi:catechol 2,3-dioxygenase
MTLKLSDAVRVKQVQMNVLDLKEMTDFYTKIVGLMVQEQTDSAVFLAAQGATDPLLILEKITPQVSNEETTGLYHTAFLLPTRKDLANTLLWLLQNEIELGAADHGYSEALYLNDPEGNGIEIYCDKPRENWDIRANGDIIGVTEELNADDLVQVADRKWIGMAPGSRIGHVHLKVSDLEATQTFYQKLGFTLTSNFGRRAKFFAAGSYHHHIGANTWSGSPLPLRQEGQLGLTAYGFQLPDQNTFEQLQMIAEDQGFEYAAANKQLRIADPNGMTVTFSY